MFSKLVKNIILAAIAAGSLVNVVNANPALDQLISKLQNNDRLYGKFSQQILNAKGEILQESKGELWFASPNKAYWFTQEPYQHAVISNGNALWLYDMDLEQATKRKVDDAVKQTPALILNGDRASINKNYQVEFAENPQMFKLTPLNSDAVFTQLHIRFNGNNLAALQFDDQFKQHTVIKFSEMQQNAVIPEGQFDFIPPKGIDIIEDE